MRLDAEKARGLSDVGLDSSDDSPSIPFRYLSCFSGIGGLEASHAPVLLCESDPKLQPLLAEKFPDAELQPDIRKLRGAKVPEVDVVVGGWPCQDISIAGRQDGLSGLRSRLLLDMLRVARKSKARTVVAENVTNLLRMRKGREFAATLEAFHSAGFPFVAWRVLNARQFGLPQNRFRLLLIASREEAVCKTLFRTIERRPGEHRVSRRTAAAGFYWTAGSHSINYSVGYVPAIKIGSSLGIISPPAVHYADVVRTISADEALRLQGFDLKSSDFPDEAAAYKAAGNAVPRAMGAWVLDGLSGERDELRFPGHETSPSLPGLGTASRYGKAGLSLRGHVHLFRDEPDNYAQNLSAFLDMDSPNRLSARAASGLLRRLGKSGHRCPDTLRAALETLASAQTRTC